MKKFLSIAAIAAMSASLITACSDSDDDDNPSPAPQPVPVTEGLFLVNSGNSGSVIPGSLTYISRNGDAVQNVFRTANERTLGNTPNDIIVYGSKLYIVVTGENTVEVADRYTLKSITQINTTELMGGDKGKMPRRLTAAGRYVFLSTFDGYVAAIDTAAYTAADIYQAGSYPEGMVVNGETLYVANSDYGQGINPSVSAINLNTGVAAEQKNENIRNPTGLACYDNMLFMLDYGSYDASWNQVGAGVYKIAGGEVTKVADATMMALDAQRGLIYTINAPYTSLGTTPTFNVYNIATNEETTFITGEDIDSPAAITVDNISGEVYIASYRLSPDTGYADYNSNGYVNRYSAEGKLIRQYEAGVSPTAFAFNYTTAVLP